MDRPVYMSHQSWLRTLLQTDTSTSSHPLGLSEAAPDMQTGSSLCLLARYGLLAVGTTCGTVRFLDCQSLDIMEVVRVRRGEDRPSVQGLFAKAPRTDGAVDAMSVVPCSDSRFALIIVQRNGAVTLLDIQTESHSRRSRVISSVRSHPLSGEWEGSGKPVSLVQCAGHGDTKSFGLLRGSVFSLYEILLMDHRREGPADASGLSVRRIVAIDLTFLLSPGDEGDEQEAGGVGLGFVWSGHVIVEERNRKQISSFGDDEDEGEEEQRPVEQIYSLFFIVASPSPSHSSSPSHSQSHPNIDYKRRIRSEGNESDHESMSYLLTCSLAITVDSDGRCPDYDKNPDPSSVRMKVEQETAVAALSQLQAVLFEGQFCFICTDKVLFHVNLAELLRPKTAVAVSNKASDRGKKGSSGVRVFHTVEAIASRATEGSWKGATLCTVGLSNVISNHLEGSGLIVHRDICPAILFYPCQ